MGEASPVTTARIYDVRWAFPELREHCAAALARDPSTPEDWHLRIFGSKAVSFMTADPAPAFAAIAAAKASGDARVIAAALAQEADVLANWDTIGFVPEGAAMLDVTTRAASAHEALGDSDTAITLMARLAVVWRGTEDLPRLLAWCEGKAAELASAGDALGAAYCLTAAARVRISIEAAAEEAARRAFAAIRGVPLLQAELLLDVAAASSPDNPRQYLDDAARRFAAYEHWRGVNDARTALGANFRNAGREMNALLEFEHAVRAAEHMGIPHRIVLARQRHADLLFGLGHTGRALAELEETRDTVAIGGNFRAALLEQLGNVALQVRDGQLAMRSFSEVLRIREETGASPAARADALAGIGKAYGERRDVGGLLLALRAFKRAAAAGPSPKAFAAIVTMCARLARWYALTKRQRPAWLRKRGNAALARGLALAATPADHIELLGEASLMEYHFGARDAALERIDEALALAARLLPQAGIQPRLYSVWQRIEYGAERRDVEMLERADADADQVLDAISGTQRGDTTLARVLYDSAWVNEYLARLGRTPEARMAASSKAQQRLQQSIDLYENANDRLRAGSAADALGPQLGQHRSAATAYELAIRMFVRHGNPWDAFQMLERLKANVLASALATVRLPAPSGVPPEVIEEEQRLLTIVTGDRELREVAAANRALDELWQKIAKMPGGDRYARLRRGDTIDWDEVWMLQLRVQEELGPERRFVILEYAVLGESMLENVTVAAFCLRGNPGPEILALNLSARDLEAAVAKLQPNGIHTEEAAGVLESLAPLLEPVRIFSRPGDLLCIIPSRSLFSLPIHAIPIDGEPLLARNPVFYASSVTTLAAALQLRRAHERTAAALGNPTQDLKGAEREAKKIAAMLNAPLHLREDATAAAFLEALRTKDIVHYAGHAHFDARQPLRSGLMLADDVLTAEELFAVGDVTATMVTLSGCETGLNQVESGDEIVGLTRAFLYAGAPTLLTSLWRVYDQTTLTLMRRFYECWLNESMTRVDALRTAALEVRAAYPKAIAAWAAFVLVGDWR